MGFPVRSPLCIAVSRTGDPVASGWFLYAFDLGVSVPDYPKLGVWPDAYYLGLNSFPNVCALDRANMLSGNPATFVCFGVVGGPFPFPADLDGSPPPIDTPAPFVRQLDGDRWGGVDRLEIFEFAVDFEDPLSSTFDFVTGLPTDPFSTVLCGDAGFGNCAEQPDGPLLETLPFFLMWWLQYRNFGTHETLVANHTIDVDPVLDEQAGIRWYELRRSDGGIWTIFQQGDFAPQDPAATAFLHRWMGSIAMDKEGNIALGFSASSRDVFPSVRYVGRRVTDPLGSLPQGDSPDGDFVMVNGEGSQFATRWGDYSSMNIDPVDGCTFWYTQQYVGADARWKTRIGAFRFPSCDRETQRVQCAAYLEGPAIDPDGNEMPIGGIIPIGEGLFRQKSEEGSRAEFQVVNVPLLCGTRLDVCLQNGDDNSDDLLLQQIFLCDIDSLAVGHAEIDERSSPPILDPVPDFETTSLTELLNGADNLCDAVVGRLLRVRLSETASSPCNEAIIVEGVIEDTDRSFFP